MKSKVDNDTHVHMKSKVDDDQPTCMCTIIEELISARSVFFTLSIWCHVSVNSVILCSLSRQWPRHTNRLHYMWHKTQWTLRLIRVWRLFQSGPYLEGKATHFYWYYFSIWMWRKKRLLVEFVCQCFESYSAWLYLHLSNCMLLLVAFYHDHFMSVSFWWKLFIKWSIEPSFDFVQCLCKICGFTSIIVPSSSI